MELLIEVEGFAKATYMLERDGNFVLLAMKSSFAALTGETSS